MYRTLNRRNIPLAAALAFAAFAAPVSPASAGGPPLSTEFSYQGLLTHQGQGLDGQYAFYFRLWDRDAGGIPVSTEQFELLTLEDGLLNTMLDFGIANLTSEQIWLQVEFDAPGEGRITLPRQQVSAAPYALQTRGMFLDGEGGLVLYDDQSPELAGIENNQGAIRLRSRATGGTNIAASFDRGEVKFYAEDGSRNMVIQNNGRVGIGTTLPQDKLHVSGTVRAQAVRLTGGADIAEPFDVAHAGPIVPGMVVAIDPGVPGGLRVADAAYDATVAGIISGGGGINAGMTLAQEGTLADGEHPVALTGRVWCLVDADANGPIAAGDLLTTSTTAGHAMKATDRDRAFGSTIGKAMTTLESGRGLVLVLVNLH
jgi:hypothetical protein